MATKTLRQVVTVPKAREEQSISEKLRNCLYSAGGMLGSYFGSHVSIECLSSEYRAQLSEREKVESDLDFFGLR